MFVDFTSKQTCKKVSVDPHAVRAVEEGARNTCKLFFSNGGFLHVVESYDYVMKVLFGDVINKAVQEIKGFSGHADFVVWAIGYNNGHAETGCVAKEGVTLEECTKMTEHLRIRMPYLHPDSFLGLNYKGKENIHEQRQ